MIKTDVKYIILCQANKNKINERKKSERNTTKKILLVAAAAFVTTQAFNRVIEVKLNVSSSL